MKILHLVPAMEAGGVETGTLDLALTLKKLGEEVIVVSRGGRLVNDLDENNIPHIKAPIHKKSIFTLRTIPQIARIIKDRKIDVVHASSRVPAWVGFLACKLTKTPFVTSCHGFYSKRFLSRVMGWGKLVMVISKSIEKRMADAFGVPKEKMRLIYRGVDLGKYPYYPDKYNVAKDPFIVINIGRLTPLKGQDDFIKAMKKVLEKKQAEAWIVGSRKKRRMDYLGKLKGLAKNLGIEKQIKFLGLRYDVEALLRKADCLVLSTVTQEGFGRTIIEAGATGTACLGSKVGGIKEIIEDGETGLLFPPRDPKKMAEAILKMLGDIELRRKCSRNLRKKVEKRFTLDEMARQTLAVYKEAVASAS